MKTTFKFEPGELSSWEQLITALTGFQALIYCDHQIPPIDVMNRIEKTFADLGMLKASRRSNLVRTMIKGRLTTGMKNIQLGLISKLNPVRSVIAEMPRDYETWLFFQIANCELNKTQQIYEYFAATAVTNPRGVVSQLLNGPQVKRFNESTSQDSRQEPLVQVISNLDSKSSDTSNVVNDASNAENVNPQIQKYKEEVNLSTSSPPPGAKVIIHRH